jgi:acetylornithine deacetylase/succinyl-diaminopimelate desuccinylase-like protein
VQVPPELEALIDAVAPGAEPPAERVAAAKEAHPALGRILGALTGTTIQPSVLEAPSPLNVVPGHVSLTLQCGPLPGTTNAQLERELREALGPGEYQLEVTPPKGGLTSDLDTPLHAAIEGFLAAQDPDARLVPVLGYGYSDCHVLREAYGSIAYGFIPFPHGEAMVNLETKHGADERILLEDLWFQVEAALSVAREIGSLQ